MKTILLAYFFNLWCSISLFAYDKHATFSSYIADLSEILEISKNDDNIIVHIAISSVKNMPHKTDYIGINGVGGICSFGDREFFIAIDRELWNSSLYYLKKGSTIALSYLSSNPDHWPLSALPYGVVKLLKVHKAPSHQFKEELIFECSLKQFEIIQGYHFFGLNGSGFVLKDINMRDDKYYFSVYAGTKIRKNTIFSQRNIKVGESCTLNVAAKYIDQAKGL